MKSRDPKVLVGIVTYEGKDYIFPKCIEAVKKFDYSNYDILIVDNSATQGYYHKMFGRDYHLGNTTIKHLTRASNTRDTLADSQNYIRNYAMKGGYEYVLFVESDLVPPPETIKRLLKHNQLVVGSVYWLQAPNEDGTKTAAIPCIFFTKPKEEHANMTGTRLIKTEEVPKFLNTGLQPCHGCGLGCTLISIGIIEKFPFWSDERFDNKHSDVYFYMDLHNKNVRVHIDTDFTVPHYPSDWKKVKDK
jgi:glycosyltransferase involved in cell wall biosynthesis